MAKVIALCTALLISGLTLGVRDTVGNQSGPEVGSRMDNLFALCGLNGGTGVNDWVSRNLEGSVLGARVRCVGGALDGLTCSVLPNVTFCDWSKVGAMKPGSGGLQEITVDNPALTFVSELPLDAASPLTPDVASEPMLVEAVIIWNPSPEAVAAAGIEQVNGCRQLGGAEVVTHASDDLQSTFTVQCEGGLLDGQWCAFGTGSSTCFFLPESTPAESTDAVPTVAIAPTSADVMDPTEPPATTEPTAPAPTATVVPTDVPVIEPTAPAVEPTLPVFEEYPTPTPTPVILT
jgi:hypothetical protein